MLGHPNFTETGFFGTPEGIGLPGGVAFSPDGLKLLVADTGNNRVLVWNTLPTTNGQQADVVIGQPNLTTLTFAITATGLRQPKSATVASDGRVVVADTGNHRVLIYSAIPGSNGVAAVRVIGQTSFTSGASSATSASKLSSPSHAFITPDGRLIVTDTGNNRVLIWNTVPVTNGASADLVIGQIDFISNGVGGISAARLNSPSGATLSASGQLAIGDTGYHRVLLFDGLPTSSGTAANYVLGQPDFSSNLADNDLPAISDRSMNQPSIPTFSPDGRLWVPGRTMRRVMIFGGQYPTDYRISLNAGVLRVRTLLSLPNELSVSEPSPGFIQFGSALHHFAFESNAPTIDLSEVFSLAGVTRVEIEGGAADDTIALGAFAVADFPALTVNGGAGNDLVTANGNITFAADANLDLDLANDSLTPGSDVIRFLSGDYLLSGTGAAVLRVTGGIAFEIDSGLVTQNGDLTVEGNRQAAQGTATMDGVRVYQAQIASIGNGQVTVRGRGGPTLAYSGVGIYAGGEISGGLTGTVLVDGIGGTGAFSGNSGVSINGGGALSRITSLGAHVRIIGMAGSTAGQGVVSLNGLITAGGSGTITVEGNGGTVGDGVFVGGPITSSQGAITVTGTGRNGITLNDGITSTGPGLLTVTGVGGARGISMGGPIAATGGGSVIVHGTGGSLTGGGISTLRHTGITMQAGQITATGGGQVTVTGIAGSSAGDNNSGVELNNGAIISSENGNVQVTGTAGAGRSSNYGISVLFGGSIHSSGSGDVTLTGTGGAGTQSSNSGVGLIGDADDVRVYAAGGSVSITGTGGSGFVTGVDGPIGLNKGVYVSGAKIEAANGVAIVGTGGTLGDQNHGVFLGQQLAPTLDSYTQTRITSTTGLIRIEAIGGGPVFAPALDVRGSVIGSPTFGGAVELSTDSYEALGTNTLATGPGGSVWIHPRTAGTLITLGGTDSAGRLGLTDAELDAITTPLLKIGDATSGNIDVISIITRSTATDITLTSAGTIVIPGGFVQTNGGALITNAGTAPDPTPRKPAGTIVAGHFTLSFVSVPGQSYVIRTTSTLDSGSFTLQVTVTATDTLTVWTDPESAVGQKFYTVGLP